ncbi:MAG: HDIG domain-containing protein [Bacteroidales bacterium]|nr:HDIG domain-containing protein [Bacteroidales bacterium]
MHINNSYEKIYRIAILLVSAAIIVYFLPREGKFRYSFQEGKPWNYGLLTASFDFPVYKSEKQLIQEQDSILDSFTPYFKVYRNVTSEELSQLSNDYKSTLAGRLSPSEFKFLERTLSKLYNDGIISTESKAYLDKEKNTFIRVIEEDNISRTKPVAQLKTIKQSYEYILNNVNDNESKKRLRASDINRYLKENVVLDTVNTSRVKDELLLSISASSGMVQAGERIVDRGEIVTPQIYNILRSLKIVDEKRSGTASQRTLALIGQIILVLILLSSILLFLKLFRNEMFHRLRNVILIYLMVTVIIILCSFFSSFRVLSVYLVPFAIVPIVVRTFLDSRVAYYVHIITILICSFIAPFAFEFILIQIAAGITTIFSLKDLTQRSQLVKTAAFVFITYCVMYATYSFISEGSFQKLNISMFIFLAGSAGLLLFAYLLIFILEKTLGFTSNVTLVELSNINAPLLRKLSEECPGTFQHALQVSNLAAQAAMKIGANVQIIRTGALYHDIGKLSNPSFFTENQLDINPHDSLTYEQSVRIIKQHVIDGIKMARKENLPQVIIDFIATHHGEGKIKYFYNKWKNEHPDEDIDEELFSYPGPNPFTREQAILMMADSIEAASRSLKDYSDESVTKLVQNIIDSQIKDGMFKNNPLSFRDLESIKEVFIERLKTMYHARISYPELKQQSK